MAPVGEPLTWARSRLSDAEYGRACSVRPPRGTRRSNNASPRFSRRSSAGHRSPHTSLTRVASLGDRTTDLTTIALQWVASQEMLERAVARAPGLHLHLIHNARLRLVRMLLPAADRIIDLGGANAPLYRMGYPHPFRRLVMVDLPEGDRHAAYGKMSVERTREGGEIELHYGDMTRLDSFPDASFDLVWSGQSIEHVDRADGMRMCREAFRVLTPGRPLLPRHPEPSAHRDSDPPRGRRLHPSRAPARVRARRSPRHAPRRRFHDRPREGHLRDAADGRDGRDALRRLRAREPVLRHGRARVHSVLRVSQNRVIATAKIDP